VQACLKVQEHVFADRLVIAMPGRPACPAGTLLRGKNAKLPERGANKNDEDQFHKGYLYPLFSLCLFIFAPVMP
jgi:hypothetical protein